MDREPMELPNAEFQEEEINEQPTFCNLCQELPEEYIALSCSHNFCLLCLTKLCFHSSNPRLVRSPNLPEETSEPGKAHEEFQIICPIDNQPSPLNSSSIEALNKVRENFSELEKKKPLYNEVIFEESAENFHTTDEFAKKKPQRIMNLDAKMLKTSFSSSEEKEKNKYLEKNLQSSKEALEGNSVLHPTPIKQATEKNTTKKEIAASFCTHHVGEETIIVCFSCGNMPLCVECVVRGEHKNHEMVNISRIRDSCKEALSSLAPEIDRKQKEFSLQIEKLSFNKKQVSDKIWEVKTKISQDLNELRERLMNKENELLAAKDCEASEKFAEIDGLINGFEEKMERLKEFQNNLELKAENSENLNEGVDLLNYFSSNREEIMMLLNLDLGGVSENIDNFSVEIDRDSYIRYLESLHNLHLTTSNLNEIEEKMRSSQKFFNPTVSTKLNIEKSVLINEPNKERSPAANSRLRFFPAKMNKDSLKVFESPLRSGHLTNSSFNLSFFNENAKAKTLKWMNKSLGKVSENRYKYELKENLGSKTFLGRKIDTRFHSDTKKMIEKELMFGVSRALETQKKLFQRRKEVFYG